LYNNDSESPNDFSEFSEILVSVHAGKNNEIFSKIVSRLFFTNIIYYRLKK